MTYNVLQLLAVFCYVKLHIWALTRKKLQVGAVMRMVGARSFSVGVRLHHKFFKATKDEILNGVERSLVVNRYTFYFLEEFLKSFGHWYFGVLFYFYSATFLRTVFGKCPDYKNACWVNALLYRVDITFNFAVLR